MVRKLGYVPSHCRHKGKNLGYVVLNGKAFYTGTWGSPAAQREYERLLSEWLHNGRSLPTDPSDPQESYRVDDLIADYWTYVQSYYRKHGEPTREVVNIRYALKPLQALYGDTEASGFGPLALQAVRDHLVREGRLCRRVVNQRIGIIKRMFAWATSQEKVPSSVFHGLQAVRGLERGRTTARESARVRPVSEADVHAVLPHVSRQVAAMLRLQWFTGMRPGEVVQMRTVDIHRTNESWTYRPASHKTEHLGKERVVWLGPRAQGVLAPWLKLDPLAYLFSPAEAETERRASIRARRRSRVTPSMERRNRRYRTHPMQRLANRYSPMAYRRAVTRGCEKAGLPTWSPNQIRHSLATRVRNDFGLDGAQVVLGHTSSDVTQVYAEVNSRLAARIAERIG